MAKIEIYETEDDVKRGQLKSALNRSRGMEELGLQNGILFTGVGLLDMLFDKIGLTKTIRESNWSKNLAKYDPFPKATKFLDKHWRTANFSIGGTFLFMAAIGWAVGLQKRKELEALGDGMKHVMIPDNLSTTALGQIPIGPVGEFELHKTSPEKIKSHAERILQDVAAEPTRTLQ